MTENRSGTIYETSIFITSIFHTTLNDVYSSEIVENIKKIESSETSRERSNINGYQSRIFQNCFDNPYTEKLFVSILDVTYKVLEEVYKTNFKHSRLAYWYNINYKNSYNIQHTHPNCLISGVFYLKVPKNSGNIVFVRPDSELAELHKIDQEKVTNSYTNGAYFSQAEENKLIIFPSYVPHYVEQNHSEEERISLSFNIGT